MRWCRNTNTALAIVIAPILICASVVLAQDFGYEGRYGPAHWGEDYARCSGKHQSPINIDKVTAVEKRFPKLDFFNFNVVPHAFQMSNNGHTVLVKMSFDEDTVPTVRGGPLAEKTPLGYQFEQFHFHWGENDTIGSEDLVDNHAYPAELHVVLRNLEYPDFVSALDKDHGIAVMAFFFQISKNSTGGYEGFTNLLSQIDRKGKTVNMTNPLPLGQYVSKSLESYYTYTGSLTTPPCSEEVTWIDFTVPIDITEKQLSAFRLLTANDDHLKNNFRPIQPLNDRTLYKNYIVTPIFNMGSIPFVNAENAAGNERWRPLYLAVLLPSFVLMALLRTSAFSGF
ncbi:carbonic anhydrase 1 isoform X1 [Drosophila gunungcola]|uniref:carbonic anhydrase 1 isoform X1 n=1 Tax=Drosophila gunungcola TaxID=103775 RepID=UPI0022E691FA|nr:carbonic anhydrase 1 isoform X1 [Drosophila gunungcola]